MKRILFSLLCLFVNLYMPLSANTWKDIWCDTWNIMEHNVQLAGDDNEETWRYYLSESIVINGQTYTYVNCYWTLEETSVYKIGIVRFSDDKKVYILSGNQELLVYDFNVVVGDTIQTIIGIGYGDEIQQLLVHKIDIDETTNRKTITLYPICKMEDGECDDCDENGYYLWECCPVEWIEGVGSTDGFLMGYPSCGWVGGTACSLLCAYRGDELKYTGYLYEEYGCEYNTVTAVEDIHTSESKVQKVIQDGQLLILHDGKTYNIMGVEVGQ